MFLFKKLSNPPKDNSKTENQIKFIKGFTWNFILKISVSDILLIVKYVSENKPDFMEASYVIVIGLS